MVKDLVPDSVALCVWVCASVKDMLAFRVGVRVGVGVASSVALGVGNSVRDGVSDALRDARIDGDDVTESVGRVLEPVPSPLRLNDVDIEGVGFDLDPDHSSVRLAEIDGLLDPNTLGDCVTEPPLLLIVNEPFDRDLVNDGPVEVRDFVISTVKDGVSLTRRSLPMRGAL